MAQEIKVGRNATKEIDLNALHHNVKQIKRLAPHSKIIAMLKADAYGHGAVKVAQALTEIAALGVAHFEEALTLRRAGITQPIILMSSYLTAEQLQRACEENLQWVIHSTWQIHLLQQTSLNKPLHVWLKIDTGMHRLGFLPQEAAAAWQALQACEHVQKPISLMTHFACADDLNCPLTSQQIHLFNQVTAGWPGARSLANSAGIFAWPASHADWVRPGIMLYGISPFSGKTGAELQLKPVMRVKAPLLAIRTLPAGACIGYGSTYRCAEASTMGVIGIGYGDGYPRRAPNGTPVYLEGRIVPLVGRVSMDMITVKLDPCALPPIGTEAILWGPELPIETVAKATRTFVYELACQTGIL
ncbi:MAG: alanine racemase [Gammaproteobacteria bacterium]|nr:alanine racemase [Gammaproteobacteria bacterium]